MSCAGKRVGGASKPGCDCRHRRLWWRRAALLCRWGLRRSGVGSCLLGTYFEVEGADEVLVFPEGFEIAHDSLQDVVSGGHLGAKSHVAHDGNTLAFGVAFGLEWNEMAGVECLAVVVENDGMRTSIRSSQNQIFVIV